jgi:hypothetical protein
MHDDLNALERALYAEQDASSTFEEALANDQFARTQAAATAYTAAILTGIGLDEKYHKYFLPEGCL